MSNLINKITNIDLYVELDFIFVDFADELLHKKMKTYDDYWKNYVRKGVGGFSLELYYVPVMKYAEYLINSINNILPKWSFNVLSYCSEFRSERNNLLRNLWVMDKLNPKINLITIYNLDNVVDQIFSNNSSDSSKFLISSNKKLLSDWISRGGLGHLLLLDNSEDDKFLIDDLINQLVELSKSLNIHTSFSK